MGGKLVTGAATLAVIIALVGGAAALGTALGLGSSALLAAMTTMACFVAAFGGALWPDLRLLAWFGPAVVGLSAGTQLLHEVSVPAAIALLTVVIFAGSLLPVLGPRYASVATGLGMVVLFAYLYPFSAPPGAAPPTLAEALGAPALAVGMVLVVRLLMGVGDPQKSTRAAVAGLLTAPDATGLEPAARAVAADRPTPWLLRALYGAARYRAAELLLRRRVEQLDGPAAEQVEHLLDAGRAEAGELAAAVAANAAPTGLAAPARHPVDVTELPGHTARLLEASTTGLDEVRDAAVERAPSPAPPPLTGWGISPGDAVLAALHWRSQQLRHALRCALAVLAGLIVALFRPGDPMMMTFLLAIFMIVQPDLRATAATAGHRAAGALVGALLLAVLLIVLPSAALLPAGLVALVVGFAVRAEQPTIFNAAMMITLVGMYTTTRHWDPRAALLEYVIITLAAVAIGLGFGFAVIPGVPRPSPAARIAAAVAALRAGIGGASDPRRRRDLLRALTDLTSPPTTGRIDGVDQARLAAAGAAGTGVVTGVLGLAHHRRAIPTAPDLTPAVLDWLDDALGGRPGTERLATITSGADHEQQLLIAAIGADVALLHDSTGTTEQASE